MISFMSCSVKNLCRLLAQDQIRSVMRLACGCLLKRTITGHGNRESFGQINSTLPVDHEKNNLLNQDTPRGKSGVAAASQQTECPRELRTTTPDR